MIHNERHTQDKVIALFTQLGYEYLGNWQEREENQNVEERWLRENLLARGYTTALIEKAVFELKKAAGDQSEILYDVNRKLYDMLRGGIQIKLSHDSPFETVQLIDYAQPERNHFAIAEEVTVRGQHNKRPDIVLYINGIAIGVLELKRSCVAVSEGIRQNLNNQEERFIQTFFSTMQLLFAGNESEGLRYGCIGTPENYYLSWKEESPEQNPLLRALNKMCVKARLLDILQNFIVYDRGNKKTCRPHQYFGLLEARKYVRKREGGIIWHTQGSGKSLTMVWLTRWIRENCEDARVLIITDRTELDEQIEKVFLGVNEQIYRCKSSKDMVDQLSRKDKWLLCSLVHKFGTNEQEDYDKFIEDLTKSLPIGFAAQGNLYVLVDECHRSQSGKLHRAMKGILPSAMFIGFTGTPLLKKDKETSLEVFGPYIHTYKFQEAVADKIVLDLRYEARDIEQQIGSHEKLDQWFHAKTQGLQDFAVQELKRKWGTMQKVLSSKGRLERIVEDILFDMETKLRLQNGRGNAILVAGSVYEACRLYEMFQDAHFTKCAVVTSYKPHIRDVKGEPQPEGAESESLLKYDAYHKMLNGKDPEVFEQEVKKKFIEEPAQMKLLIVVDKLLTGFDAPPATYLYIDKKMRDHGLFQAICRVNRLDQEDKEYGYVIDYKDLFKSLEKSIKDYTSGAFDEYDSSDVLGLVSDRIGKGRERLDEMLETVRAHVELVFPPKGTTEYITYFCGNTENQDDLDETAQRREAFYKAVTTLLRAYANIANDMTDAGYSLSEATSILQEVRAYEQHRQDIMLASGDYIDLKKYEPAMRALLDTYIDASSSKVLSDLGDLTLIELLVQDGIVAFEEALPSTLRQKDTMAELIENNVRRKITEELPTNPMYFEEMSVLLEELIRQRKEEALDYQKYLERMQDLTLRVVKPETSNKYPVNINTGALRALFDNLDKNEDLAMEVHQAILETKKDSWKGSLPKEREVKRAIKQLIEEPEQLDRVFELVKEQKEYE